MQLRVGVRKSAFKTLCASDPRGKETFKPIQRIPSGSPNRSPIGSPNVLTALTLRQAIPHVQPVVLAVALPHQQGVVLQVEG